MEIRKYVVLKKTKRNNYEWTNEKFTVRIGDIDKKRKMHQDDFHASKGCKWRHIPFMKTQIKEKL